ncbi:hypothetical protein SLE2022_331820 [Rubroshorea leprosula]
MEPVNVTGTEKASTRFNDSLIADVSERFRPTISYCFFLYIKHALFGKNIRMQKEDILADFLKSLTVGHPETMVGVQVKACGQSLIFQDWLIYELFEMDAHIGAKELDLQYMNGEQTHCGFPERNFSVKYTLKYAPFDQLDFARSATYCQKKLINLLVFFQIEDDSECSALFCLLAELRPVEITNPLKLSVASTETERKLLRHTGNPFIN